MRGLVVVLVAVVVLSVVCVRAEEDEDFYEILGLGEKREDATPQEIKVQFRRLSKQYHPDLAGEQARDMYVKVQRAYEVLSDKKRRKIYDMKGMEGLKQLEQSQSNPHAGVDPFLRMFGFGGGGREAHRGQNANLKVTIPLADVYNGQTHQITIEKQKLCKKCHGTGAASKADFAKCKHCDGKGVKFQRIQLAPGFIQEGQSTCPHCGGSGRSVTKKCPVCHGSRVFRGPSTLELEIDRGIPEDHAITFEMEADQSPDVIPGDVIVQVTTKPDEVFKRKDNKDLEATVKITLREALLGFSKTLRHMDGHVVSLSGEGVTQYGTRVKIRGEGMPIHNVPSERGDLYITYIFEMPRQLTERQREILRDL